MIYLIGGVPRVGKSTLGSLMLERDHISCLSTDVIRNLLDYSPTRIGIKDTKLSKKSEIFFPYFLQLLKILQNKYSDYVVEGDLFTVEQLASMKERIQFRCCFLGTSNITLEDIKKTKLELDWVSRLSVEDQVKLPEQFIKRSQIFKIECAKYNFPYYDVYPDRQTSLEAAYTALVK